MNRKEFAILLGEIQARTTNLLALKSAEYSTDVDKLHNFKRAAEKRHTTPEEALMGMKLKHDVSVDDLVDNVAKGILPSEALLEEKITDSINYLILLEALIKERIGGA